jgi:hypothetical protein
MLVNCFLAWGERIVSISEMDLRWNLIVVSTFLQYLTVSMKVDRINSYVMNMLPKVGAISFNEKVINEFLRNQLVFEESLSFLQKNKDSYVLSIPRKWGHVVSGDFQKKIKNSADPATRALNRARFTDHRPPPFLACLRSVNLVRFIAQVAGSA